jgi:dihydroorotase
VTDRTNHGGFSSGATRIDGARHSVVIRGGTVVDAAGEHEADVFIRDGEVVEVEPGVTVPRGATVLDAGGCLVAPGLVDLHTHLRQPGAEDAETIETGARAAALGGFTAVLAMPNTDPPVDSAAVALEVLALGAGAMCQVAVAGAITVGRAGERLAPMGELASLGVRLFTDDGAGVQDVSVMRRALEYARGFDVTLAQHCEDDTLARGGHMHEGEWSSRLGVPGIPAEAEEMMVARDIALARLTGGRVHFLHLSTARSAALVRAAKDEGLAVTAEVTPHHLSLTHAELAGYDPVYKVNPPLRCESDVCALRTACALGTIDAIATDHAPHAPERKDATLDAAPPGMLGLQTALPVVLRALGENRGERGNGRSSSKSASADGVPAMSPREVLSLLSWRPARIAGLARGQGGDQGGPIEPGAPANICVIDLSATWEVDPFRLASRSRNTPWAGRVMTGQVRHTIFRGEPVVIDAVAQR